jgi:hypothetical protein
MTRVLASATVLALLMASGMPASAAPDCAGGTLVRVRAKPGRLRIDARVTRAGLAHAALQSSGLALRLVAPDDPGTTLWSLALPPERFASHGKTTVYDGQGTFDGRVLGRDWPRQADTVRLVVVDRDPPALPPGVDYRLYADVGGACARTCVARCATRPSAVVCRAARQYVPAGSFGQVLGRQFPAGTASALCGLEVDTTPGCDPLIEERCILPYPSSVFLDPDPGTPTGLRIHYGPDALPANIANVHVDPTDWNTLDGFSPGPTILALLPDTGYPVDLAASNVAFHTDYARSLDADHPTVLMDADSGERVVHFAEMDANTSDVTRKALIIRPGRRLDDGHRYLVALRSLVDTQGTPITPRLVFRAMAPAVTASEVADACGAACSAAVAARRARLGDTLDRLAANGVDPGGLVLAWDFTTASRQALTDWIVAVRDQAFALGTPSFTVTSVDDGGGAGRDANIFERIEGTFQAPLFMTADAPASRLNLVNGVPTQNGYATVPYVIDIPRSAWNGSGTAVPARPTLWGHGLLGNRFQVTALSQLASTYNFVIGGVDMQGMSQADLVPAIVPLVQNFSLFHYIPERLHQGFLNHLLLGRLMVDPVAGFDSHPAFQFNGTPIIDTTEVYYSGGSQGGIFGIAIMSIAEDFKRGFLAVPGANYSLLLHRSIDFNPYLSLIRVNYPDALNEQLLVALTQQLWDRAEPQGYLNHLVAGDLSTPPVPHKVLMHMATYDSEVSNVATEIAVRSLGISQLRPVHRSFFQIPELDAPFDDSAFVEVDPMRGFSRCNQPGTSNPGAPCTTNADCPGPGDPPTRTRCDSGIPPLSNTPPLFNNGAHGATGSPPMGQQIDAFLRPDGQVLQFCNGPCDNPD